MEMKVAAKAPVAVVEVAAARWLAAAPTVVDAIDLAASLMISVEDASSKRLLYCHAAATAYNIMRQVPCVCCRPVIHAAMATQARIAAVITVLPSWLNDSTCMVQRTSTVVRSVAAILIAAAPAVLVAPAYRYCMLVVNAGVRQLVDSASAVPAKSQGWCAGRWMIPRCECPVQLGSVCCRVVLQSVHRQLPSPA